MSVYSEGALRTPVGGANLLRTLKDMLIRLLKWASVSI